MISLKSIFLSKRLTERKYDFKMLLKNIKSLMSFFLDFTPLCAAFWYDRTGKEVIWICFRDRFRRDRFYELYSRHLSFAQG